MSDAFTVTAIVAAHNEADILEACLADLAANGVRFWVIDDESTDGTGDVARRFRGRGLVGLERREGRGRFSLAEIVARKQALAHELESDWFVNADADEFREGPWAGLDLAASVRLVDVLGFNAVDFEIHEFPPTRELLPGEDPRAAFTGWEPGALCDRLQIRCWKRTPELDLVSSGGHEAAFPGRRVFPLPFLLRHYPVRGQAHGERKVFAERKPRFDPAERARGWHVQYDAIDPGHRFLRDPATLEPWDPALARARLALRHRGAEELRAGHERALNRLEEEIGRLREELGRAASWANRLAGEAERSAARADAAEADRNRAFAELEVLRAHARTLEEEAARHAAWCAGVQRENAERGAHLATAQTRLAAREGELAALRASRTWRWTAGLRALASLAGRGRG